MQAGEPTRPHLATATTHHTSILRPEGNLENHIAIAHSLLRQSAQLRREGVRTIVYDLREVENELTAAFTAYEIARQSWEKGKPLYGEVEFVGTGILFHDYLRPIADEDFEQFYESEAQRFIA